MATCSASFVPLLPAAVPAVALGCNLVTGVADISTDNGGVGGATAGIGANVGTAGTSAAGGGGATGESGGDAGVDAAPDACQPDCVGKVCGDDGCEGSCGDCTQAQHECEMGTCVCKPDCAAKNCGPDGCQGTCGSCNPEGQYCDSSQTCVSCETARCGVCDEIDVSTIVSYGGSMGADQAGHPLNAAVLSWPITTELEVAFPGGIWTTFTLDPFPGETWVPYAAMVACWDMVGVGIHCQLWDWWDMSHGGNKSFDWPEDRPVAHMLISTADEKRTAIRHFDTWPHNNPDPPYTSTTIGTNMPKRDCQ